MTDSDSYHCKLFIQNVCRENRIKQRLQETFEDNKGVTRPYNDQMKKDKLRSTKYYTEN